MFTMKIHLSISFFTLTNDMEEMIPSRLYDISEWRQRRHSMAMWRPLYALSSICWDPFGSSVCVCVCVWMGDAPHRQMPHSMRFPTDRQTG